MRAPDDAGTTITMRVAIAGRISLRQLANLLDEPVAAPAGLAGTAPPPQVRALIARGHDVSLVTLDPDLTSEVVLRGDRLTERAEQAERQPASEDHGASQPERQQSQPARTAIGASPTKVIPAARPRSAAQLSPGPPGPKPCPIMWSDA